MSNNGSAGSAAVSQFLNNELEAENAILRNENHQLMQELKYARQQVLAEINRLADEIAAINNRTQLHTHTWSDEMYDGSGVRYSKCLGLTCPAIHYKGA